MRGKRHLHIGTDHPEASYFRPGRHKLSHRCCHRNVLKALDEDDDAECHRQMAFREMRDIVHPFLP